MEPIEFLWELLLGRLDGRIYIAIGMMTFLIVTSYLFELDKKTKVN